MAPGGEWVLTSGMTGPTAPLGRLYAVSVANGACNEIFPYRATAALNTERFIAQPDLNPLKFRPHGIDVTLRPDGRVGAVRGESRRLRVGRGVRGRSGRISSVVEMGWRGEASGHRRRQRCRRRRPRFRRQYHRRPGWPYRGQRRGGDGRSRYGWCAGMVTRPRLGHVARHADQHGQRRRGIARRSVGVHRRLEFALPEEGSTRQRRPGGHHCGASTSWSTT